MMDETAVGTTDERMAAALEDLAANTKKLRILMERQTGLGVLDSGNGEVHVARVGVGKLRPAGREGAGSGRYVRQSWRTTYNAHGPACSPHPPRAGFLVPEEPTPPGALPLPVRGRLTTVGGLRGGLGAVSRLWGRAL
jgi:hypothetical protein